MGRARAQLNAVPHSMLKAQELLSNCWQVILVNRVAGWTNADILGSGEEYVPLCRECRIRLVLLHHIQNASAGRPLAHLECILWQPNDGLHDAVSSDVIAD